MPGKHGPNRFGNYLNVHEAWMASLLREGFVVEDRCEFTILPSIILLHGPILCLDAITIDVVKQIDVLTARA